MAWERLRRRQSRHNQYGTEYLNNTHIYAASIRQLWRSNQVYSSISIAGTRRGIWAYPTPSNFKIAGKRKSSCTAHYYFASADAVISEARKRSSLIMPMRMRRTPQCPMHGIVNGIQTALAENNAKTIAFDAAKWDEEKNDWAYPEGKNVFLYVQGKNLQGGCIQPRLVSLPDLP